MFIYMHVDAFITSLYPRCNLPCCLGWGTQGLPKGQGPLIWSLGQLRLKALCDVLEEGLGVCQVRTLRSPQEVRSLETCRTVGSPGTYGPS
jgi:hypothetical protein